MEKFLRWWKNEETPMAEFLHRCRLILVTNILCTSSNHSYAKSDAFKLVIAILVNWHIFTGYLGEDSASYSYQNNMQKCVYLLWNWKNSIWYSFLGFQRNNIFSRCFWFLIFLIIRVVVYWYTVVSNWFNLKHLTHVLNVWKQ